MKVFLDPGHGGTDPGAIAGHGGTDPGAIAGHGEPVIRDGKELFLHEASLTLSIARHCEDRLAAMGVLTVLSRSADYYVPLSERVELANQSGADLFVSIHCNSAQTATACGHETLIWRNTQVSRPWAEAIQRALVAAFPDRKNRGVRTDFEARGIEFKILRETDMAAVLVECGFLSNEEEALWVHDHPREIGEAIAAGILEQAGMSLAA